MDPIAIMLGVVLAGLTGVGLCVVLFGLMLALFVGFRMEKEREAAWRQAAEALGARGKVGHLTAQVDGLGVRVLEGWDGRGRSRRLFTDVLVGGPSERIQLRPQSILSGLVSAVDHQVGSDAIDDAFVIGGHALALGLLDAQTRSLLARTNVELTVSGGVLRLRRPGTVRDAGLLNRSVGWGVALAKGLMASDVELVGRLRQGVASDPEPGVRRRFLEVLRDHVPEQAVLAAHGAAEDPDPSVRLLGQALLGQWTPVVEVVGDAEAPDALRIEAIEALVGTERLVEGVQVAVSCPDAERLWRAAALACGNGGSAELTDALAELGPMLDPDGWPSGERRGRRVAVARAVAAALGALPGSRASEDVLIALLGHDDAGTRTAAVASLAAVGTVAAVPALKAVEDGAGILSSAGGEARKAIRAVQARAGGARGGLAVAEQRGGQLSVAQAASRARVRE